MSHLTFASLRPRCLGYPCNAIGAIRAKLTEGESHARYRAPNMHEICERLIERFKGTVWALVQPETAPEPS